MDSFSAQAPTYRDFNAESSHEDNINFFGLSCEDDVRIKEEPLSPDYFQTPSDCESYGGLRRSISVGNLYTENTGPFIDNISEPVNCHLSSSIESLKLDHNYCSESKENLRNGQKRQKTIKFESMAEQINRFHLKTPNRYHTVSSKAEAVKVLVELNSNEYVKPKTPKLLTKSRIRATSALTYEQRKELEYKEALKNKPKPRQFNRDILHKAPSLPNVERLPVTKFEPFNITKPKKKPVVEEKVSAFKAKPLPVNILQGPVGIKERPPPKVTNAKTPNIKMPRRKSPIFKNVIESTDNAKPLKPTKIMPFSFEERNKKMLERKEKFIKEYIEREQAKISYQARPMPKFETPKKSCKMTSKPLVAKTPNFASKKLREEAERRFKEKLEQEEQEAKAKALFKAQPPKVLYTKPFEPKHNHQDLKVHEFKLSSEARARARREFDEQLKLKEQEKLLLEEKIKEEQQKREQEEILKIRKNLVRKAQPIKNFRPFEIKRSERPPTQAVTPCLGNKRQTNAEDSD